MKVFKTKLDWENDFMNEYSALEYYCDKSSIFQYGVPIDFIATRLGIKFNEALKIFDRLKDRFSIDGFLRSELGFYFIKRIL